MLFDFGFLDLVRPGVKMPADSTVATSLAPTASALDGNFPIPVICRTMMSILADITTTTMARATATAAASLPAEPITTDRCCQRPPHDLL
jgi:hypothetical protein